VTKRSANTDPEWQVSAADFVRNFSKWRESSHRHPIYITHHSRPSHVLTTIEYFERLHGDLMSAAPSGQTQLFGLADWVDEAIIAVGEDEEILYFNRLAEAACRAPSSLDLSVSLSAALPAIRGTLFELHLRRTLVSREPTFADIPSPFKRDSWLHLSTFPLRGNTVLMFRDITEDVERDRRTDMKRALVEGILLNGNTGYVSLSVRGTIAQADATFCNWVGLDESRLAGVPIVDLAEKSCRVPFREKLESALSAGQSVPCDLDLVANGQANVQVHGAIVPLHGAYGAEGAVIVFTRCA
jgi:PAS domain-containing protein